MSTGVGGARRTYERALVTVGTTRFDALCERLLGPARATRLALRRLGVRRLTLQLGRSATGTRADTHTDTLHMDGITFHLYRFKDSIQEDIQNADLVISHAGAGSCLEVLEQNKPLLVVVNEDLMDNHQLELAEQLQILGHLYFCTCSTLESTLLEVDFGLLKPFAKPDTSMFVKYLDSVLKVKQAVQ